MSSDRAQRAIDALVARWPYLASDPVHAERLALVALRAAGPTPPFPGPEINAYERGVAEGRRQATEGWDREWGARWMQDAVDPTDDVFPCHDEADARDLQERSGGYRRAESRLVGPWEAAELAKPTCTCPLIDVTVGGHAPSFVKGYDPACPACPNPYAEQAGDGRG